MTDDVNDKLNKIVQELAFIVTGAQEDRQKFNAMAIEHKMGLPSPARTNEMEAELQDIGSKLSGRKLAIRRLLGDYSKLQEHNPELPNLPKDFLK